MASEHHLAIEKEQLTQLLSYNTKTSISNSLLAMLLAYILWDVASQEFVGAWIGSLVTVNFIRFLIGWYFQKHPEKELQHVTKRLNTFRIGLVISAILWGLSHFLVFGNQLDKYQLFVAYMIAGMSAGTAVAYSIDLVSALSFTYLAIIPMLVIFILSGNPVLIAMTIAGVGYLIFITLSMKAFNVKLIEGIELRWDAIENAKAIEKLAFYDELTNLPNRRLLMERMETALVNSLRTGKRVAIMFLDLDHFKTLNDNHGHDMGDLLLQQLAQRLEETLRDSDTIARLGGDEFVVMLENIDDALAPAETTVIQAADKVLNALQQPYQLNKKLTYTCSPSIGVAISGGEGNATFDELLKNADAAMYAAKSAGRNMVKVFDAADADVEASTRQEVDEH